MHNFSLRFNSLKFFCETSPKKRKEHFLIFVDVLNHHKVQLSNRYCIRSAHDPPPGPPGSTPGSAKVNLQTVL